MRGEQDDLKEGSIVLIESGDNRIMGKVLTLGESTVGIVNSIYTDKSEPDLSDWDLTRSLINPPHKFKISSIARMIDQEEFEIYYKFFQPDNSGLLIRH